MQLLLDELKNYTQLLLIFTLVFYLLVDNTFKRFFKILFDLGQEIFTLLNAEIDVKACLLYTF